MNQHRNNPYVGPRTFKTGERHLFFGRKHEAEELLALVISGHDRLLLFYAESGAGKSSLINTCLIPDLKAKSFEVLPVGRVSGELQPETEQGNVFVYNLLLSLDQSKKDPGRFANMTLPHFLDRLAVKKSGDDGEDFCYYDENYIPDEILPRALIIDQFEEIFTNLKDWKKRRPFFEQLRQAMEVDPYLWVILAMREDHIAALEPYEHLLPGRLQARFYMQRMGYEAALKAVMMRSPVKEDAKGVFEEVAAKKLVENLRLINIQEPGRTERRVEGEFIEPVQLQVVCYQLWERLLKNSKKQQITDADLTKMLTDERKKRGLAEFDLAEFVDDSLAEFYEQAIKEFAENNPDCTVYDLRRWFEKEIITSNRTRNLVFQNPESNKTGSLDNDIVDKLRDRYLLRAEYRGGNYWYELVHDRFIDPILQSNARWFERHPLIRDTQEWEQEKDESHLYRGLRLERARKDPYAQLEPMASFIKKSEELEQKLKEEAERDQRKLEQAQSLAEQQRLRAEAERKQAEAERLRAEAERKQAEAERNRAEAERNRAEELDRLAKRLRWRSRLLLAVFLLTVTVAILAYIQWKVAENAQKVAEIAQKAAEIAQGESEEALAETKIERSRRVADQAQSHLEDGQLDRALLLGVAAKNITDTIEARQVLLQGLEYEPRLTTFLHAPAADEQILAYNPDTQRLALGSNDGAISLWNMGDGQPFGLHLTHTVALTNVVFSPSGQMMAIGIADTTFILWDVDRNQPRRPPLTGHTASINSIVFSPDEQIVASASDDNSIILWDTKTGQPRSPRLTDHADPVLSLAFSPSGQTLASGSADGTIILWNLQNKDQPRRGPALTDHPAAVSSLAFSSDSQTLASGNADGTIILWNLQNEDQPRRGSFLVGHTQSVNSLTFSSNDQMLASASNDKTVILWGVKGVKAGQSLGPPLAGHTAPVTKVTFEPNSEALLSIADDGSTIQWDTTARQRLGQLLTSYPEQASSAAFSRDGHTLALGLEDGSIILRQVDNHQQLGGQLKDHSATVNSIAFSPDGQRLASGDAVGTIIIRNLKGEDQPLTRQIAPVHSLAFSPDGQALALGGLNGSITLWDLEENSQPPHPIFTDDDNPINSLAFSPDGQALALGGLDGNIKLWDLEENDQRLSLIFTGDDSPINSLAFSQDRQWLALGRENGSISLWNMSNLKNLEDKDQPLYLLTSASSPPPVNSLLFNPEGQTLQVSRDDGSIMQWDIDVESWETLVCLIANRNPTWSEWEPLQTHGIQLVCPERPIDPSFIETGRNKARRGDIAGAIARFALASKLDPNSVNFDPQFEARQLAVESLVEEGKSLLVEMGDVDGARTRFKKALELDPGLELDPDVVVYKALVKRGRNLVEVGDVDGALAQFEEVRKLAQNLSIDFNPRTETAQSLVTRGRNLAEAGDVKNAIDHFEQARNLDPSLDRLDPETEARELAAQGLVERGKQLALVGDVNDALTYFDQALELNSDLESALTADKQKLLDIWDQIREGRKLAREGKNDDALGYLEDIHLRNPLLYLNPTLEVQQILDAQALMKEGSTLAQEGKVNDALDKYRQARDKDPGSGLSPEAEVAQGLVERVKSLAEQGRVEEAIDAYGAAQELDPTLLNLDPEVEVAHFLFEKSLNLAEQGQVEAARLAYREAKKWDSNLEDLADYFASQICRFGTLGGNSNEDILKTCDEAVVSAPDDGWTYNYRGVVRALMEDYEGAIEDFEFFVKWSQQNDLYEQFGQRREAWIIELNDNQNPFDKATLEELRNE